jgi:hypothetical protein
MLSLALLLLRCGERFLPEFGLRRHAGAMEGEAPVSGLAWWWGRSARWRLATPPPPALDVRTDSTRVHSRDSSGSWHQKG